MSIPALILASNSPAQSVTIPFIGAFTLNQTYSPIEAKYSMRTGNGSLVTRVAWVGKLSTTISGQGVVPPGLSLLDYSIPLTMSCVGQRAITVATATTVQATLPAARRTDVVPFARAILADDVWVPTAMSIATNTATVTKVTDALFYQVMYYPKLTVMCTPPEENWTEDAYFNWTMTAEEV
jgi:hypothetical protein